MGLFIVCLLLGGEFGLGPLLALAYPFANPVFRHARVQFLDRLLGVEAQAPGGAVGRVDRMAVRRHDQVRPDRGRMAAVLNPPAGIAVPETLAAGRAAARLPGDAVYRFSRPQFP